MVLRISDCVMQHLNDGITFSLLVHHVYEHFCEKVQKIRLEQCFEVEGDSSSGNLEKVVRFGVLSRVLNFRHTRRSRQ